MTAAEASATDAATLATAAIRHHRLMGLTTPTRLTAIRRIPITRIRIPTAASTMAGDGAIAAGGGKAGRSCFGGIAILAVLMRSTRAGTAKMAMLREPASGRKFPYLPRDGCA